MRKAFQRLAVLAMVAGMTFGAAQVQAGPGIHNLSETNLADSSYSPFHLNTDRYKNAFQSINGYLTTHEELPAYTILLADNHGHLLHGVVSDWTYYTYGTHKGIELYVFNPEDGNQFLTVELWLPKEQQRNIDKRESYLSSFQQIESFLSGSAKYRLDLVFQDNVDLEWGKGYEFKLDDEGISLSFAFVNAAHPKAKAKEVVKEMTKPTATAVSTQVVKTSVTAQVTSKATVASTITPTTKSHKKKKSKSASSSASAPAAVPTASSSDDAR